MTSLAPAPAVAAPSPVTRSAEFRALGPDRACLYQVRPGLPRDTALSEAECLMSYARQRMNRAVFEPIADDEAYALCLILDAVAGLYAASEATA